jgi:transcriptional regulator with XRE-family HTH domain
VGGEEMLDLRYKTIGNNIKVLRDKYNYTQSEVANFLNINSHVNISQYENGERKIPLEHLSRIADLFNVELEVLLTDNPDEQLLNNAFAFRKEELKGKDFETIANFHKIVKNYLKLRRLEKKHVLQS